MNTLQTKLDLRAQLRQKLSEWKGRLLSIWIVLSAMFIAVMPSGAQSTSISITPEDLDVFFVWFNTMFSVVLPIALIGAGLVAGATFAFIVGVMLKKAFQSLGSSS
jgi:hypothetical protein